MALLTTLVTMGKSKHSVSDISHEMLMLGANDITCKVLNLGNQE